MPQVGQKQLIGRQHGLPRTPTKLYTMEGRIRPPPPGGMGRRGAGGGSSLRPLVQLVLSSLNFCVGMRVGRNVC